MKNKRIIILRIISILILIPICFIVANMSEAALTYTVRRNDILLGAFSALICILIRYGIDRIIVRELEQAQLAEIDEEKEKSTEPNAVLNHDDTVDEKSAEVINEEPAEVINEEPAEEIKGKHKSSLFRRFKEINESDKNEDESEESDAAEEETEDKKESEAAEEEIINKGENEDSEETEKKNENEPSEEEIDNEKESEAVEELEYDETNHIFLGNLLKTIIVYVIFAAVMVGILILYSMKWVSLSLAITCITLVSAIFMEKNINRIRFVEDEAEADNDMDEIDEAAEAAEAEETETSYTSETSETSESNESVEVVEEEIKQDEAESGDDKSEELIESRDEKESIGVTIFESLLKTVSYLLPMVVVMLVLGDLITRHFSGLYYMIIIVLSILSAGVDVGASVVKNTLRVKYISYIITTVCLTLFICFKSILVGLVLLLAAYLILVIVPLAYDNWGTGGTKAVNRAKITMSRLVSRVFSLIIIVLAVWKLSYGAIWEIDYLLILSVSIGCIFYMSDMN